VWAATLSAACSPPPVEVPPPSPEPAAAAACQRLHAALPAVLDGLERRATAPPSDLTQAWGRPAVTLRCGVPTPGALRPTSQLFTANGVDWLPVEGARTWTFTTIGRVALVEVTVPKAHDPPVGPLVDLARPILDNVPAAAPGRYSTQRRRPRPVSAGPWAGAAPSG
jgi:hypothetical protein